MIKDLQLKTIRVLECDWPCTGEHCHEETKSWNSIYTDICFQSLLLKHVQINLPDTFPHYNKKTVVILLDNVANISLVFWENSCILHFIECFLSHNS